MTVGIRITIPRDFALTATAVENVGLELYVYENGTTTPVALFSDRACTVPAANPIVSAAGYFPRAYMASAQLLTLTLKNTAGSTIHSDDYVDPEIGGTQSVQTDATLTTLAALTSALMQPQGRLTLTTAVPVTVSDVTGATAVYYTPHQGNLVPLYDGTEFVPTAFTELSQTTTDNTKSPAAVANNSNYDMFVWLDGSTVRCTRGPAWTSDTGRGTGAGTTELERVKGIDLNKVAITNGPAANRGTYVGTVRSNGSAQINDSLALRMVWNCYNRRSRPMRVLEATDSWTYSTATYRQANNSAANQLAFVRGLNEDAVTALARVQVTTSTTTQRSVFIAIGLDSTTALDAGCVSAWASLYAGTPSVHGSPIAHYRGLPGLGYHFLAWLERGAGGDTQSWYGDNGAPTVDQSGMLGEVFA